MPLNNENIVSEARQVPMNNENIVSEARQVPMNNENIVSEARQPPLSCENTFMANKKPPPRTSMTVSYIHIYVVLFRGSRSFLCSTVCFLVLSTLLILLLNLI